jgi:hypothetical protein
VSEQLREPPRLQVGGGGKRVRPEDLAVHGRRLQQVLLGGWKEVDASGDDPLHRLRQPLVHARARLQHPHELLGVERVAGGALDEDLLGVGVEQWTLEQRQDETGGGVVVERDERDGCRVPLAAAPAGPAFEQLGPGRTDDEQRHAIDPIDEPVDEVEQAVVRPVEVLDDEHHRTALGHRLEKRRHAANASPRTSLLPTSTRPSPTSGRRWPSTQARSPSSAIATMTPASFVSVTSAGSDSRILRVP